MLHIGIKNNTHKIFVGFHKKISQAISFLGSISYGVFNYRKRNTKRGKL